MILNYSEFIPCSCGGILEKMDWKTHLIFNIATVIVAAFTIVLSPDPKRQEIFKICESASSLINSKLLSNNSYVQTIGVYDQKRK